MKTYWIYDAESDFFLGCVMAKDWVDARLEYAKHKNVGFDSIYACANPL